MRIATLWLACFLSGIAMECRCALGGSPGPTAPSITSLSNGRSVPVGTNVTFSVSAAGTSPLAYQWFFNGTSLNQTNRFFTLVNVQEDAGGNYAVVVTNDYGAVTSAPISLVVTASAPWFLTLPKSWDMVRGGEVTFRCLARGSGPLTYQWQFQNVDIPDATNTALVIGQIRNQNTG